MKRSTIARALAAACAAVAAAQAFAGPQEDLSACGAIADAAERLACYDRIAGRAAAPAPVAAKPPGASPPSAAAPAPPAAPTPLPPASPASKAPAPPAAAAAPAAPPAVAAPAAAAAAPPVPTPSAPASGEAAKPAAPPADARSFGSYSAEHPAAPEVPQALTVRVTALGKTIDGLPTMTLEGGALWLLDEKDPLLAVGDTVAISRGLLGSFLMETPTKRLHHVRRIR